MFHSDIRYNAFSLSVNQPEDNWGIKLDYLTHPSSELLFKQKQKLISVNRCRVQQDISGALPIIKNVLQVDESFWPGFAEGQVLL